MFEEVHVIWWQWHDKSGAGIARVHSDNQRAQEERDLLEAMDNSRQYHVDTQPLYSALKGE
jgi:hypothetical protein